MEVKLSKGRKQEVAPGRIQEAAIMARWYPRFVRKSLRKSRKIPLKAKLT